MKFFTQKVTLPMIAMIFTFGCLVPLGASKLYQDSCRSQLETIFSSRDPVQIRKLISRKSNWTFASKYKNIPVVVEQWDSESLGCFTSDIVLMCDTRGQFIKVFNGESDAGVNLLQELRNQIKE